MIMSSSIPNQSQQLRRLIFKNFNNVTTLMVSMLLFACTALGQNAIATENTLPGNPRSEWDVVGAGDLTIQGFATDISVNKGETVHFKIKTDADSYVIDIYRLGYYGGLGARKVGQGIVTALLPQTQPAPVANTQT